MLIPPLQTSTYARVTVCNLGLLGGALELPEVERFMCYRDFPSDLHAINVLQADISTVVNNQTVMENVSMQVRLSAAHYSMEDLTKYAEFDEDGEIESIGNVHNPLEFAVISLIDKTSDPHELAAYAVLQYTDFEISQTVDEILKQLPSIH